MRTLLGALLPAVLTACAPATPAPLSARHAAAITDSVRQLLEDVAAHLDATGPLGWLDYFQDGPEFSMASDGVLLFPSIDSARSRVRGFAPGVARLEIEWTRIHVDPLAPGLAAWGTGYREVLRDTAGGTLHLRGYVTGLATHTRSGWRLRQLHWSQPVP